VDSRLKSLDDLSEVKANKKKTNLIFANEVGNKKEICYEKN
jgi:hypothetical protein